MNYCCRKKMAGAAGFEPTHGRIKTCCLTAWLRPCILSGCFGLHPSYVALLSKACNGEVLHPLATKACRVAGNRARTLSASRSFGKAPNKQLPRSEEHTSELQSRPHLVCRLLLEKKKI